MAHKQDESVSRTEVQIPSDGRQLKGTLSLPKKYESIVVFAHGSGSGRFSACECFMRPGVRVSSMP
jgi:hypothetical protein